MQYQKFSLQNDVNYQAFPVVLIQNYGDALRYQLTTGEKQ